MSRERRMRHYSYLAVLAGCLLGAGWLEVFLRTHVLARWRRLVLTLVPVLISYSLWDWYAIGAQQWSFDAEQTTGIWLASLLPLDEVLFFVIVPICSILAFEAVRSVRGWPAGDEP